MQNKEYDIVQKLLSGDQRAISVFVDEYGTFVYHVCYKILLQQDEAQEASQDAIMKILNALSNFDIKGSLKAWCYTIAYRTAIDYKRKIKYTTEIDQATHLYSDNNTDDSFLQDETKYSIQSLLNHLHDEDKMIVSMYYLEEMNIKEVCKITGLSESNIKIKLYRARKEMALHAPKYFDQYK
jgi:RNA polymerase sigma factor (sigma-70 family)